MFKYMLAAALAAALIGAPIAPTVAQTAAEKTDKKTAKKPAPKAETKAAEPAAEKKLTAQQQKMKDCGAKWQEYKKANNVKGKAEYQKFLKPCLKG
jgi:hypothetical protein